jgi:hypothetical protein
MRDYVNWASKMQEIDARIQRRPWWRSASAIVVWVSTIVLVALVVLTD